MTEEQANTARNALVEKWLALSESIFDVYREADRARREEGVEAELYKQLDSICAKCIKMLKNYDRG